MVSVDTMTAPEFQRRGLLSEVGRTTYAHWRDGGVAFVLGLPNERWGSRTRALGWTELFPLQWLTRPLRPARLLARRTGLPEVTALDALWNGIADRPLAVRGEPVSVRVLAHAEAALDRLWAACRGEHRFSVVRDRAWLQLTRGGKLWAECQRLVQDPDGFPVLEQAYFDLARFFKISANLDF